MKEIEEREYAYIHIQRLYIVSFQADDSRIRNSSSNAYPPPTIDYDRAFVHPVCLSSIHARQIHLSRTPAWNGRKSDIARDEKTLQGSASETHIKCRTLRLKTVGGSKLILV